MAAYAAFLRGINVGGHQVKGSELRAPFEALGFTDVATFRASGNVVFRAGKESRARMTARLEQALEDVLGYEVAVFLRDDAEVRAIAGHEPFPPRLVDASGGKLQVSLLAKRPPKRVEQQILGMATDEDRLAFGERELYWLPSGGMMDTALDLAALDKLLGVTTRRTMGTIEQLVKKYFSD